MVFHSLSISEITRLSAIFALKAGARDNTVVLVTLLFFIMVLVSAYLGWSATDTVNAIYAKAVPVLQAQGKPIPPNPVGDTPVLSLFRNMVTYVGLLGALAALVLGHQTVAADRKAGVMPLLFSRPVSRNGIVLGKIAAIIFSIVTALSAAGLVNALTMLALPGLSLKGTVWLGLLKFYGVSALYMVAFGLLGAVCAAAFKTESMALLVPITIWLALTFIVPQVTANIGPMAALNPQSANLVVPAGTFFDITSAILGPISIAESYRYLASSILKITSGAGQTTVEGALLALILTNLALAWAFILTIKRFDACRSTFRD